MSVAMLDSPNEEVRAHLRTFIIFERLVLFATLHVVLVLTCLALAFLGHAPVLAVLLGVGGTIGLIAAFAIVGPGTTSRYRRRQSGANAVRPLYSVRAASQETALPLRSTRGGP